jgi:glycine/D-amino acid oxidase-like deaminating enzyme
MQSERTDIAVIGAGNIGIAVAYYLTQLNPSLSITLIDERQPMSLTSAVSGENYRNWWPHPIMKRFIDRSIDLMQEIDAASDHSVISTHSGYVLVTRDSSPDALLDNLQSTFANQLRFHNSASSYQQQLHDDGADALNNSNAIQQCFPGFDPGLQTLVHIRRGGSISAHTLGSVMLKRMRDYRVTVQQTTVNAVESRGSDFLIHTPDSQVIANQIVNAAGPSAREVSSWLGVELPVVNVYQQKIAFADIHGAIDRSQPFTIDLDPQHIDWTEDERAALSEDSRTQRFTEQMPGAIHCRPDGGAGSNRIKLGWAYNNDASVDTGTAPLQDHFPEIVVRGAARLHPALKQYYDGFPRDFSHYGGYYTMTEENWPLIGATSAPGYFIATAMSGFGSMAACAAGELAACYLTGGPLPDYAEALSLQRSDNQTLMREIQELDSKGIL